MRRAHNRPSWLIAWIKRDAQVMRHPRRPSVGHWSGSRVAKANAAASIRKTTLLERYPQDVNMVELRRPIEQF
jgi:hypothetical protein